MKGDNEGGNRNRPPQGGAHGGGDRRGRAKARRGASPGAKETARTAPGVGRGVREAIVGGRIGQRSRGAAVPAAGRCGRKGLRSPDDPVVSGAGHRDGETPNKS